MRTRTARLYLQLTLLFACMGTTQEVFAGKGFMGGQTPDVSDEHGQPGDVGGPTNDRMADAGHLYGDLFKILRYQGGEVYTKALFSYDSSNRITGMTQVPDAVAVGGEPVLSLVHGYYAAEVGEDSYELATAPYPSHCVQPVADYRKWGDISVVTGLSFNRLPLVVTYDPMWTRSECEVGDLVAANVDPATGELVLEINDYFVPPCTDMAANPEECTWNGTIYCDGVRWADMVDEVHFGRLNLSRAPEAVLQAAFDEAVQAINAATWVDRDAAGRLELTTVVYEDLPTGVESEGELACMYAPVRTVVKAIDSPLENLALYVKLLRDGHLVTPGNEREPIDRSERGGMPIWKLLELSDGPSAALRPSVDIEKLRAVFPNLVDVAEVEYYTYYECLDQNGTVVDCMCDTVGHDGEPATTACDDVESRELVTVDVCPDPTTTPNAATCEGPWTGIETSDGDLDGLNDYVASTNDFDFAAAFLAAAADKTGELGVDMVVYLNSILGINKVVGYSEYTPEGEPTEEAIDYSKLPSYFDFSRLASYDRPTTMTDRGENGAVVVLQSNGSGGWVEQAVGMNGLAFRNVGVDPETGHPTQVPAAVNILGFTQMADDDLTIIEFVHTYQIPELR